MLMPAPLPIPAPVGAIDLGAGLWFDLPALSCRATDALCWNGRAEWRLHFGWPAAGPGSLAAVASPVCRIQIVQVRPSQLRSLRIVQGCRVVYDLDSCDGPGGRLASAGELLAAMAAVQGQRGLTIDAADIGVSIRLPELGLFLGVWADADLAPQVVRVRAQVRSTDDGACAGLPAFALPPAQG